jgi:iron complex transport system substrate-binding protein
LEEKIVRTRNLNKVTLIMGILVFILVCSLMAGCGGQKVVKKEVPEQIKIKDSAGREVTVPGKVEKVVDMTSFSGTEIMVQLDAADKLVGVGDYVKNYMYGEKGKDQWNATRNAAPQLKDLPCVGSYKEPNAELIISLNPDIIFCQAADVADSLYEQTDIPVVCISSSGCLDFETYRLAGKIVGKEDRAEELISYAEGKIAEIKKVTSQIPEAEKVKVFFWLVGPDGKSDAPKTYASYDPIIFAGGIDVAMEANIKPRASFDVSKEQIAVWNPDIVLVHGGSKTPRVSIDNVLSDPALQTTNAIKNKKVYFIRAFMIGWDPTIGVCEVPYVAKLLYPDKFKKLDVEKECNEILKKFYGVDGLWTELLEKSNLYRWE